MRVVARTVLLMLGDLLGCLVVDLRYWRLAVYGPRIHGEATMSSIDLSSFYTRLRALRQDPDPKGALRDLWNDLGVSKGKLSEFEAELHSAGVEILEDFGWIDLGDDKCVGIETSNESGLTDHMGAAEIVLDLLDACEDRERRAEVLFDVLRKDQKGPWLKSGLQKHEVDVGPLFYPTGKEAIPKTGSDGEPVRRLKTMDRKFMKQPKRKEENAA